MKHVLGIFLFLLAITSQAQNLTVTGTVTDASDGMPIPGVSVIIKGTTTGTITNIDGFYQLMANENDVLVFSFVGMKSQEVTATTEPINVALEADATDLDEVVVVGYGVQKKALVTGANVNVKGEKIAEMNTGTPMEALQGVTPGVNITRNNGAPGAGTKVTIRGIGTIGHSAPLYIIDGVASDNIDYLNASDIESIDVLKDAASAAIYGSRAANGVILVTTKKGKKGQKATVSYDGYYGVQNVYKNVTPLTAQEYMFIMDEGRRNDGLAPNDWEYDLKNNPYIDKFHPYDLSEQLGDHIWGRLQEGWKGTNWVDEMTSKNAPIQNHSVNITGASEDISYALGISYFDQKGLIGGDITDAGLKRYTARLNTEMIVLKTSNHNLLTVGENITYTNTENRGVATGNIYWNDLHNAIVQNPLMPAYWDMSPDAHGFTPTLAGIANDQHNPLAVMHYRSNYNWGKGNEVTGNVYAELQPIKDLKFRSSFGIKAWFGHSRSWGSKYDLGDLYKQPNDNTEMSQYQGANHTFTNTITYEKLIGDHKFNVLVGNEILKYELNSNVGGWKQGTVFEKPDYAYLDDTNTLPASDVSEINTWGADWAANGGGLMSYMGRASYNYKERYMVDATIRYDGSSNFADGNRWGTFPSFSAGWIFSDESFASDFDFMTFGKLRASWGQNGNERIDNFIYSANIEYVVPGYFFGDTKPVSTTTAIPANVPNPDVTWETSEQLNIGFDTRFLASRLGFTFDWYQKITKDWLVIAPILGTSGASAPWVNGGDIKNSGIEFAITWNDNIGDFKYGATISGAHNKNEVTKLANAEGIINGNGHVLSQGTASVTRVEVGSPIGFFYGYQTDGLLQNQDDVEAYVAPPGADNAGERYFLDQRPGDVKFVDQNGDGEINEKDKVMLGDPHPDFELGISLNAEYKGFYANTTLTGKFGMQVMKSYRSFADRFDQNYTTEIFGRWHGEGTSNRIPRLSSDSHRNQQFISDIYMHDADYLRINNLTIGYKFDKLLQDFEYVKGAKLYLQFNNLYTFTGYDGMDPEVGYGPEDWSSGVDLGLYPLPRTVMLGVNVTF